MTSTATNPRAQAERPMSATSPAVPVLEKNLAASCTQRRQSVDGSCHCELAPQAYVPCLSAGRERATRPYHVTVYGANDNRHRSDPAAFAVAASLVVSVGARASSVRTRPGRSPAWPGVVSGASTSPADVTSAAKGTRRAGGPVSLPAQCGQIRTRPRDPVRGRALAGHRQRTARDELEFGTNGGCGAKTRLRNLNAWIVAATPSPSKIE